MNTISFSELTENPALQFQDARAFSESLPSVLGSLLASACGTDAALYFAVHIGPPDQNSHRKMVITAITAQNVLEGEVSFVLESRHVMAYEFDVHPLSTVSGWHVTGDLQSTAKPALTLTYKDERQQLSLPNKPETTEDGSIIRATGDLQEVIAALVTLSTAHTV
jgi:hypothetical protein